MSLPIDRTAKSTLDANLVNGNTSDAPAVKNSNDVVYNTVDELNNKVDGLVSRTSLSPYPPAQYNQLINGSFEIWQRGTIFSGNGYTSDRWQRLSNGTGQVGNLSRQAHTPGNTEVPNNPRYFLRNQVTTVATGQTFNTVTQKIEGVRLFAGLKATLSFYAKADAARNLSINLWQNFGTGGTTSASVSVSSDTKALTTAWQKFTYTFTVPSIIGKDIGLNNDDYLQLEFSFPNATIFTIDISQVQFNAGDIALPFQARSLAEEFAWCQRYYEKSFDYNTAPADNTGTNSATSILTGSTNSFHILSRVDFKEVKRVAPTITFYNPLSTNANKIRNETDSIDLPAQTGYAGTKSFHPQVAGVSVIEGKFLSTHWTADSEL